MGMLAQNVFNPEKTIEGSRVSSVLHGPVTPLHYLIEDLSVPIMWGSKTIVINALKNIYKKMNVPQTAKVRVYSYILATEGFRRIQIYNGPIENIGKYFIRY